MEKPPSETNFLRFLLSISPVNEPPVTDNLIVSMDSFVFSLCLAACSIALGPEMLPPEIVTSIGRFAAAGNRRIVYCQLACADFNAGSARNDGIFNGECGVCAACLIDTMTGNRVRSEVAGAI